MNENEKQTPVIAAAVDPEARDRLIIRTSIIGIAVNILLAGFKAAVGLLSRSIAITLDAVNNLSDALSSLITIIGTRLAGKPADRKHPYGHGRVEYLSASIIALIILYAGITSLSESIKKILHPVTADYSTVSLIIVAVAVAVKIILGRFVSSRGKQANSDALIASGKDALFDAVISASTLAAAAIYLTTGIGLEAWLGAVISLVIIKAGFDMLRETISEVLGERIDSELAKSIKTTIAGVDGVEGVYDLLLNNYGPGRYIGSVDIEVIDTLTADQIDTITRNIQDAVYGTHGVILAAVGIYSINTKDDEAAHIRMEVTRLLMEREHVVQIHGFYVDTETKRMRFDVIVGFSAKDRYDEYKKIVRAVQDAYPDYHIQIAMDTDFSD